MPKTRSLPGAFGRKNNAYWAVAAILLAACAGVGALLARHQVQSRAAREEDGSKLSYEDLLRRASTLQRGSHFEEAMARLRLAIDKAPDQERKALAGLKMGQTLLERAKTAPKPYALMAREYFLAASDLTADPATRKEGLQGVIEVSRIANDRDAALKTYRTLLGMTDNPQDKNAIYLELLDDCLERGTWPEMTALIEEARNVIPKTLQPDLLTPLEIEAAEKVLQDKSWFADYCRLRPDQKPADAQKKIFAHVVSWHKKNASRSDSAKTDSLFRMARLHFRGGDGVQAKKYIREFLDQQPAVHMEETLQMLATLSRVGGDLDMASQMITTYFKKYTFDEAAEKELFAIADMLEQKGRFKDAHKLVSQIMQLSPAEAANPLFLARAVTLANRVKSHGEAWENFNAFSQSHPDETLMRDVLLKQADICMAAGNAEEAERWLATCFSYLPINGNRADVLFRLYQAKEKRSAPPAELLATGIAALKSGPSDRRSVDSLMRIAGNLEQEGLRKLAETHYDKMAMLEFADLREKSPAVVTQVVCNAMLGKARCMLKQGDVIKADHLLREICRSYQYEPVRSEAAYWWATIATANSQGVESLRRLGLVKPEHLTPELAAKVEIERVLARIETGGDTAKLMEDLFSKLAELPEKDREESAKRGCEILLSRFEEEKNVEGMRLLLGHMSDSAKTGNAQLDQFVARVATAMMKEGGSGSLVRFLETGSDQPGNEITALIKRDPELLELFKTLEESKESARKYL